MENYIIIAVIALLAAAGIRSSVKHFKGQGSCCGGGGYRVKKKRLPRVTGRKLFKVEGMKCENCKNRVEEAVNDISGAAGRVNLKKGELTVLYSEPVEDDVIISKVERLGYHILSNS